MTFEQAVEFFVKEGYQVRPGGGEGSQARDERPRLTWCTRWGSYRF